MVLCVRECFDVVELGVRNDKVESLWVRIRGTAKKAEILLGVCYKPPSQDEKTDEMFYKQLANCTITSPCSHGGLQFFWCILEIQYRAEEAVWEISAVCRGELPDAASKRAYQERCPTRSTVHKALCCLEIIES